MLRAPLRPLSSLLLCPTQSWTKMAEQGASTWRTGGSNARGSSRGRGKSSRGLSSKRGTGEGTEVKKQAPK